MSSEYIISVAYNGANFTVATDAHYRIKEIKLEGKWWPVQQVTSLELRQELQREIDAMPLDAEAA